MVGVGLCVYVSSEFLDILYVYTIHFYKFRLVKYKKRLIRPFKCY